MNSFNKNPFAFKNNKPISKPENFKGVRSIEEIKDDQLKAKRTYEQQSKTIVENKDRLFNNNQNFRNMNNNVNKK